MESQSNPRNRIWSFGQCSLDERRMELTVAGELVDLETRPAELLLALLTHAGELVTKDELLETVWPGRIVSESVLTKTVAKLRHALRDEDQGLIRTVYGQGYRLIAPVAVRLEAPAPLPASPSPMSLSPGNHVPHRPEWLLEERLSPDGANHEVWLARHDTTGQPRVFKFARDAEGASALKREVALWRVLNATPDVGGHLLEVVDWNLTTAPFFLECPFVSGGNLAHWFDVQRRQGPLALALRLELVAQVAATLAGVHAAGVLHKDIKPTNLLMDVDAQGRPLIRLADFGSGRMIDVERLAQLEITRLGLTQTFGAAQESSGTPLYLAPEVLMGQAPSPSSDMYALGVLLYQIVVGDFRRPLAPGWEREVADPSLSAEIAACADVDPAHRSTDARELARRLRDLAARAPASETPDRPAAFPPRRRFLVGAVAGVAGIAIGTVLWRHRRSPASSSTGAIRLAILPFTDMSPGGIEAALSDGLAGDVIMHLERVPAVRVTARDSAFLLKRAAVDDSELSHVREQLGVDYVVYGKTYRNRDRLRVTLQTVHAAGGKILAQDAVEETLAHLAEFPQMIAVALLRSIGITDSQAAADESTDAYELYLKGDYAYQARSPEAIRAARDYFQRAVDVDAGYPRAYAGLAKTWLAEADYGYGLSWRDAAARAQPLLDKALKLEPDLLEGLIVQGALWTNFQDQARARTYLERAVAAYPGSARARFTLGLAYDYDAMPRPAIEHYALARELDPLSVLIDRRMGMSLMWLGRYDDAASSFKRSMTLAPKLAGGHWGMGSLNYARGNYSAAVLAYRDALDTDSRHASIWNELAWIYMDLGLKSEARAALSSQRQLVKAPASVFLDQAQLMFLEGHPQEVPEFLKKGALLDSSEPGIAVDVLMFRTILGEPVEVAAVDRALAQMRSDPTPWSGSYFIFLGYCAELQYATLYTLAGRQDLAEPLMKEVEKQFARLKANGNVYHTLPYFEARIAALRGRADAAFRSFDEAVGAGWRRAWWLAWDPSFRALRDDSRYAALLHRVDDDMTRQRRNLGTA